LIYVKKVDSFGFLEALTTICFFFFCFFFFSLSPILAPLMIGMIGYCIMCYMYSHVQFFSMCIAMCPGLRVARGPRGRLAAPTEARRAPRSRPARGALRALGGGPGERVGEHAPQQACFFVLMYFFVFCPYVVVSASMHGLCCCMWVEKKKKKKKKMCMASKKKKKKKHKNVLL
jgi:hypothetical protein